MRRAYTTYYLGIMLLSFLLTGMGSCGIAELFGERDSDSPTKPCAENIPTATPEPIIALPVAPAPATTPDDCSDGPGTALICKGEPVVPPVIIILPTPLESTPIPTEPNPIPTEPTPIPRVIVDNTTISCGGYSDTCGINANPPCCFIQDGVSIAHDNAYDTVYVRAGTYNLSSSIYLTDPALTLEAASGVIVNAPLATSGSTAFTIASTTGTTVIKNFTINGYWSDSTVFVQSSANLQLENNSIEGGGYSGGSALSMATGSSVNLSGNSFIDNSISGLYLISCSGGSLTTDGNNMQSTDPSIGRNTSLCNTALDCPSSCSSPF